MKLYSLIKIVLFYFIFTSYSELLFAKEYWVLPPSQPSELCTTDRCLCNKNNACVLSNSLLKNLQAGDSVYFEKGIYPAFIINDLHGTIEKPITFNGSFSIDKANISLNPKKINDFIEIKKSSHITLTGFNIQNAPRAGIRVNNSHYIKVENNKLTNNGVWGIFTNHANHFIASNNTILGPAQQHGIYHSNSGDHVQITSNFIQNFNGCGIHMNGDLSMGGAYQVKGDGIISDVKISNNYLSGNGSSGGSAINLDGIENGDINNNIIVNNKAAGLSIFQGDGAAGSSKINVTDNLIIMAKRSRWAVNIKNAGGENLFTNNIIISQDSFKGIYDVLPIDLKTKKKLKTLPFTANNNVYGYGRNLIVLNDKRYLPLDKWQQDYRNDQDSSKIFYKYVISEAGKLSEPMIDLLNEKNIAKNNSYLFLLH